MWVEGAVEGRGGGQAAPTVRPERVPGGRDLKGPSDCPVGRGHPRPGQEAEGASEKVDVQTEGGGRGPDRGRRRTGRLRGVSGGPRVTKGDTCLVSIDTGTVVN